MARVSWGVVGERLYEAGLDRGVLYADGHPGVAWPGLISVVESPNGGDSKQRFIDGVMYLNTPTTELFEGTISAYNKPAVFAECDGIAHAYTGLFVTAQRRKSFGFSYRTKIGNDVNSNDHGYKLHIIYGALAEPSQRSNTSIGDSVNPTVYSWKIATKPVVVPGYARTSHLVIDSTVSPPTALATLEDILYGTPEEAPRLPTPTEIFAIFEFGFGIIVTDNGDGTFTVTGPDDAVSFTDATTFQIVSPAAVYTDAVTYEISSA